MCCCSAAPDCVIFTCSFHIPPQFIIPIPVDQMEKTTLGKMSCARLLGLFTQGELAKHITCAEELLREWHATPSFVTSSTQIEKALAKICARIFNIAASELSTYSNSAFLLSMLSGECICPRHN
ncbi:hypothetical protein EDB19DRAFT_909620 [Suillus lakei]|nr:hypothetical protein EDB19DRAFT_909620 [Suillus lakei]